MKLARLRVPTVILLALAATSGLEAQQGDDLDLRVEPPSLPAAFAPDPLAERLCTAVHALPAARKAACCAAPRASQGLALECSRVLSEALRAGRVSLSPAAVERCERASTEAFAGCDWVTPLAPPPPGACAGLLEGLLDAGASCTSSIECRAGLTCRAGAAGSVCTAPGAPGASCGGAADLLAIYLKDAGEDRHPECAGVCGPDRRCAVPVARGASCLSTRQCAAGTHCAGGRCVEGTFAALGAPCTGNACGDGAACREGRCVALKEAGEACSSPFECRAACNIPAGATAGTCGMRCGDRQIPVALFAPPAASPPRQASNEQGGGR